jgi:hypothetical protein
MPAVAGVSFFRGCGGFLLWIPAYAGMTKFEAGMERCVFFGGELILRKKIVGRAGFS